jgi:DNA-directed RNA polymerase specialized sigma24 family protein
VDAADHDLLKAAGQGDGSAFAELVRRYQRLVRWRLTRLVPEHQVDDLAQEVFVDLAKTLQGTSRWTSRPLDSACPSDSATNTSNSSVVESANSDSAAVREVSVTSLAAWLVAVSRRKAANYFRASQRYENLLFKYQRHQFESSAAGGTMLVEGGEIAPSVELTALADCLERLQPKYREIVDGYYAHGQSAEVLAVHMARTPGAIRMILMRIRRSLAKCIARKQSTESSGHLP